MFFKLLYEVALVAKTCGQSHFCYCFSVVHQSLCLTDAVLKLKLMRCKPHFCLKTSDKMVFTDKCVLCHFFNTKFGFGI